MQRDRNHADHLNTPRLVADAAGTTVWRWDQQEPFGNSPADENPSGLGAFEFPLRLPGQYFDKETNLHYNYFRDYDPNLGRYAESDPIGLKGGINTYAYVRGDPLRATDPTGENALLFLANAFLALKEWVKQDLNKNLRDEFKKKDESKDKDGFGESDQFKKKSNLMCQ